MSDTKKPADIIAPTASPTASTDITDVVAATGADLAAKTRTIPVGCPVQYALHGGPNAGQFRGGVIVKQHDDGSVNLQVFTDGDGNKVGDMLPAMLWVKNVIHDAGGKPGTFRAL